jgi:putative chitinase
MNSGVQKMTSFKGDQAKFFASLRATILGPTLDTGEVQGTDTLCTIFGQNNWPISWVAYGLATAYHETAHTMLPIKENGGSKYFTRMYDITGARPKLAAMNGNMLPGDGAKYPGRGYSMITWYNNYQRFGKALGIDLIKNPDLALDPTIAAKIMEMGMRLGMFTGISNKATMPLTGLGSRRQFIKARTIINGVDDNELIADYAIQFQTSLAIGGWA